MGWVIGSKNGRWIGYGVPAICDQPDCGTGIDRGLSYLCGDGEEGCGLFFCGEHLFLTSPETTQRCSQCVDGKSPFEPTADTKEWISHILTDTSWDEWRRENFGQIDILTKSFAGK